MIPDVATDIIVQIIKNIIDNISKTDDLFYLFEMKIKIFSTSLPLRPTINKINS